MDAARPRLEVARLEQELAFRSLLGEAHSPSVNALQPPERLVSVVVPVYNEHANIAACLRGLWSALEREPHEILVVHDTDEDTTLGAIARMPDVPPTLRLVRNRIGRGAANALRAGFDVAAGDVIVTTMADLSDPPEKILELARKLRASGAAVVAGSRYMPGGSQEGGPIVKRTLSRVAGLSLHWFAGMATHDATNNFKAYSRAFLRRTSVQAQGAFDIGLELSVKAHLAEAGVAEVPTRWRDRSAGESRFKVWSWAPKYLRWYVAAMTEPALVWLAWSALALWVLAAAYWRERGSWGDHGVSLLAGALGAAAILLARRIRGRMRWWDAALALPWTNPRHSDALRLGNHELALGVALSSSALMLLLGCGPRRCLAFLVTLARSCASLVGLRVLAALALTLALALRPIDPESGTRFVHAGPMWTLVTGEHGAALAWDRAVLWDGALRTASALLIALALLVASRRPEAALAGLLLLAQPLGHDLHGLLACLAAGVIGIRNTNSGWLRALCMTCLAALAFTKTAFVPLAVASAAAIVAAPLLERSWWSAAVRAGFFAGALCGAWWLARSFAGAPPPLARAAREPWAALAVVLVLAWSACSWPARRATESALGLALLSLLTLGAAFAPSEGMGLPLAVAAIAMQLVPVELEGRRTWARVAIRALPLAALAGAAALRWS
ncbi:MAG: glycosyltransferase [Planctomycetes bacterium]|nr:glycosyltransferase [Planctomycetota bacterium]